MEPLLPPEGTRVLEDLSVELVARAASLAGRISNDTAGAISALVRSMNCYYSNLIEGHHTHPVDIERALRGEYSKDSTKRNLQLEAFAHIEVQRLVDDPEAGFLDVVSTDHIRWLHREFCRRLPEALLVSRDGITNRETQIVPGEFRSVEVVVGHHLAPVAERLPEFMRLFEHRYDPARLSKVMRVVAVGASHHRLLWVHPFVDGNGRVARLFSHAYLRAIGIGSGLWSVSRGLARSVGEYKERLAAADRWRDGDVDGRGSLSLRGLTDFCEYFLRTCIDQVRFMEGLLEPATLLDRVRRYCVEEVEARRLPRGSYEVLRELILSGPLARAGLPAVTGYQERQNRKITAALMQAGLVVSKSPRGELRLAVPHHVVESWFPELYPAEIG